MKPSLLIALFVIVLPAFAEDALPGKWTLTFRVIDEAGAPVSGVEAWLPVEIHGQVMSESFPSWKEISNTGKGTAAVDTINWTSRSKIVSNNDGQMTFPPRSYPVAAYFTVHHPLFEQQSVHVWEKENPPDATGVVKLADVVLKRGVSMTGTVLLPSGAAAVNAWVATCVSGRFNPQRKLYNSPTLEIGAVRSTRTDAAGRYKLTGLKREEYYLAAWTDALGPAVIELDLREHKAAELKQDLALKAGEHIVVRVVEGEASTPVVDASVGVSIWDSTDKALKHNSGQVASGKTGADGSIRFDGLPPNSTFHVTVGGPRGGFWRSRSTKPGDTELVHFQYGTATFQFESTEGKIEGFRCMLKCIDSGRDSGATWARGVHPTHSDGFVWKETGDQIEFKNLIAGRYELDVLSRGHSPQQFAFTLDTKGLQKTIRLDRVTHTLRGRLLDADSGEPVAGKPILISNDVLSSWYPLNENTYHRMMTDMNGSFQCIGLRPAGAERSLLFNEDSYIVLQKNWTAKQNDEDIGDIRVHRAGSLGGILHAAGKPNVMEAQLWTPKGKDGLEPSGLKVDHHGTTTSGEDGAFLFPRIAPGRYLLDAGNARQIYEVRAGEKTNAGSIETARPLK